MQSGRAAPAAPLAAPHRAGGSRLSAALCGGVADAAALRRGCRGARRGARRAALLPLAAAAPRVSDVSDMTADGSVRRGARHLAAWPPAPLAAAPRSATRCFIAG
jgi:hypothetical protein